MTDENGLPRFSDFVIGLMESANQQEYQTETGIERQTMRVEELRVDMPFELDLHVDGDKVQLLASPPTQRTETTVMPVFHQVRLTVRCDEDDATDERSPYER